MRVVKVLLLFAGGCALIVATGHFSAVPGAGYFVMLPWATGAGAGVCLAVSIGLMRGWCGEADLSSKIGPERARSESEKTKETAGAEVEDPPIWYTARVPLANKGESWDGFVGWIGRLDLQRVVTLDPMLAPDVYAAKTPEDWSMVVDEDYMLSYCTSLPHLVTRMAGRKDCRILAVMRDPLREVAQIELPDFTFAGYDLVDVRGVASTLLNCGGYPEVFTMREISLRTGLLEDHQRAREIQRELKVRHPDDPHADCHVWAIWERDLDADEED